MCRYLFNLTHRKRSPLPKGEGYKQQFISSHKEETLW